MASDEGLRYRFVVLDSQKLGARRMQYRLDEVKVAVEICTLLSFQWRDGVRTLKSLESFRVFCT